MFKIQINVGKPGGIVWKDVTAVRHETVEDAYTAKELWYPGASPRIVRVVEDITFAPPPPREPVYDENEPEDDVDEYDLDGWKPYTDVYEDGRSYA